MPAVFLTEACKIHESILDSWAITVGLHLKASITTQKSTNAVNSQPMFFYNHQASNKMKFNLGILITPTRPFLL